MACDGEDESGVAVGKTRQVAFPLGDADGSGSGGKYININTTGKDGKITKNSYEVSRKQYDALKGILIEHYNNILSKNDEHSQNLLDFLSGAHVIQGVDSNGQYIYDEDQLLQNGYFWMLDDATRDRIERETDGKVKFRRGGSSTQQTTRTTGATGRLTNKNPREGRR